ncbi:ABC transporter ATP-binding protein [Streptomyces flavofungini]|uniref:ABC transporter ATP-binding protein n=1 Tax=Streptomyces flavofungini TaxID=68200 RepID=A0ABS0XH24_9ACTN|nr:ABC transporter ATP-binding protein [Streptomyces flavofungini]MBJ3812281.1 ABC transporter ATP-binding protein [Streptomyces flavofungini]GHC70979.1 ABC di/oligopeptide transporter ATPase [Streptomyces flavofungini]
MSEIRVPGTGGPGAAPDALLEVTDLTLRLPGAARPVLDSVSLTVAPGEVVALVGESGSGKSTTAKAALGLFPPGAVASGSVRFDGAEVLGLTGERLRAHRARGVALVHQDPRAALNPVRRVGDFLVERGASRSEAVELLASVGLPDPERRVRQRPHELSGGMLQRVVIAGALAARPRLLLADEATSALDVTTQADILALLRGLRAEHGLGLLFITHDLHLAAAYSDRVYVMYAGRVVESRTAGALFTAPAHPYTQGLLTCSPTLGDTGTPLHPIPGRPPSLSDTFPGCPFTDRCAHSQPTCETWAPIQVALPDGGTAACALLADSDRPVPSVGSWSARRAERVGTAPSNGTDTAQVIHE